MDIKGKRGKAKWSQDVIRMLHKGGSDAADHASGRELAWGLCRTHRLPTLSVKIIYTDLLITLMNH